MYPIKKILVCLDLSELDSTLIKFASFISKTSGAKKIYVVNILRDFNVPEEIKKEFPGLFENAIQERLDKIKKAVDQHFDDKEEIEFKYLVKQGIAAKKILKISIEKEIDLIICGRKTTNPGSGVLPQRLARRASCKLLIVPEGSQPKIKKLLVPSDFSEYSVIAMEEAVEIATKATNDIDIICQNVFTVPVGYHYTGKSYEEFVDIMEQNAKKNFQKFLKGINTHGLKIKEEYSLDKDDDPVQDIYSMALKTNCDAIIIGAKGRTATTALFLGSMAERLIQLNMKIPLLVVRPKGKNAGIIELLKEI
jgi:nucleotide-binding universal stress UspA family protein